MNYYSHIEHLGERDLTLFRDAVLAYCAALKENQEFYFSGSTEAAELLRWLGVRFQPSDSGTPASHWLQDKSLADGGTLPSTPLTDFRRSGYLGTTLFAALVRSSYGPDEPGFFPTQSELGFYFDEANLLTGPARWDEDYLQECQLFFFEELTPAELVEQAYALLPEQAAVAGEAHRESLEGVAFLIGEQTETLVPLARFFDRLLISEEPLPEFAKLVDSVDEWSEEKVEQAWAACQPSESARQAFAELPVEAPLILQACGPKLLAWRSAR